MTDEDLERRLREMLATRALDVSATIEQSRPAVLGGQAPHVRRGSSGRVAEQEPQKSPRGRVRALVAAALVVAIGSTSLLVVRENREEPLVVGNEPGEAQAEGSPASPSAGSDLKEQALSSPEQTAGVAGRELPLPRLVIDPAKVGFTLQLTDIGQQAAVWGAAGGPGVTPESLEPPTLQLAKWDIADGSITLFVQRGPELYDLQVDQLNREGSEVSKEVVAGRSVALALRDGVNIAMWSEGDFATVSVFVESESVSIRDVLGAITEVSEDEWLALGRSIEADVGEWPLPRLVIDPTKVGFEIVSKGQFDNSANPQNTRERTHIQSFREAPDGLVGPMMFVVSDADGSDFLRSGQTQGLESFVVDGYDFYEVVSGGNPQMFIGAGPAESSVTIVGVGMSRSRVAEFAQRMRAPLPGSVAWRVPDPGPAFVPVFAGFRRASGSPTAGLSQFASWEIGGDVATLLVSGGGEAEFEYQLYQAAMLAWGSVSIGSEVVVGRPATLISSSLVRAAVWRENDQATVVLMWGSSQGTNSSAGLSTRDLVGTISKVSEAEWLALGRSIEADVGELPAVTAPPRS